MKIAVAIEKPEKTSLLSEVFGRSNFFLIKNSNDYSEEIITNPFVKELGGAVIQSARILIENNVDVVITKHIGINPYRFLASADIKVYLCKEGTARDAIRFFNEGKLTTAEISGEDFIPGRKRKRLGRKFGANKFFNNKKRDV